MVFMRLRNGCQERRKTSYRKMLGSYSRKTTEEEPGHLVQQIEEIDGQESMRLRYEIPWHWMRHS